MAKELKAVTRLRQSKSWLTFDTVLRALRASLVINVFLGIVIGICGEVPWDLYLAAFIGVNLVLWAINLCPLVAAWRREIAWHDPIVVLFALIILVSATILPAYAMDPLFAKQWASFDTDLFTGMSQEAFVLRLCEAEIVLIIFAGIVLVTNERTVQGRDSIVFVRQEAQAIQAAASLFVLAAMACFVYLWRLADFSNRFISQIGALDDSITGGGKGRYWLLMNAGLVAVPLLLASNKRIRDGKRGVAWLVIVEAAILLTALPNLMTGSRIAVLVGIGGTLITLRHLGVRVTAMAGVYATCGIVLMIGVITLTRQNQSGEDKLVDVLKKSRKALFWGQLEARPKAVSFLYDIDRVSNIAMVQQFLRNGEEYLYGRTMTVGLVNTVVTYYQRIFGGMAFDDQGLLATSHVRMWRFGVDRGNAAPPSYAGEFYMQCGYAGLVMLSLVLGLLFRRLRMYLFGSTSMIGRFTWCTVCLTIVFNMTVEVSFVFSTLIVQCLPCIIVCGSAVLLWGPGSMQANVRPSRATRLKDAGRAA